ncbi:MAG: squalene/phytoene synthase family protein [Terricaulis sp.]
MDEDRWLASRFAPAPARARLVALYALNYEIARTAEAVTQGGLGDIRLAWWSQAIDEIYAGKKPRAHPVLTAFAEAVRDASLPRAPLDAMIAARGKDLDAAPFRTWIDLNDYLEATAGNVMRLALTVCGAGLGEKAEPFVRAASVSWGYAGLLRAAPFWAQRGRNFFPSRDMEHRYLDPALMPVDFSGMSAGAVFTNMMERGRRAHAQVRDLGRRLPSAFFPAIGYLALAPLYYRALMAAQAPVAVSSALLRRQWSLLTASATGKL